MKRLFVILSIITLLFVACSKPEPEPVVAEPEPLPFEFDENLQNIDTLLQHDAATALQELLSSDTLPAISTEAERSGDPSKARAFTSSEKISAIFNGNYYQLLLSEALYKTDNPQETHGRASLQAAMRFFDSLAVLYPTNDDLTVLSARSHYMNGVGFYENDSLVEACKEYLHTLEIMENHFNVEKLRGYRAKFMGLTYTRLGELFFNNGIARPSLESYKNALICFLNLPNYSLANTYRRIGGSFYLDQQTDSALYYYRKAIDLAKKQNKITIYSSSLAEAAPLYSDMGYIDSAFMMIRESLTLPMNNDQRLKRYYILGTFFAKEYLYDSASFYLEKSVNSNSYATRTVSAEILINCYQALGDTAKTQYYKMIYGESFSKYRNNTDINTELTQIFEIYNQEQLQKKHLETIKKRNRYIILSISLILIIVITFVILIKNKILAIKKKSHDELEEKDKSLAAMKRKMEANPFVKEPICKYILKVVNENSFKAKLDFRAYKNFALDRNQIMMLRDAVDRHYNSFTQLLSKTYPELTFDDLDYCCLYLLGLKEADIAALMQRAYPTVCQRSRKIKRIFNTKESLQSAIAAMAFQAQCNA